MLLSDDKQKLAFINAVYLKKETEKGGGAAAAAAKAASALTQTGKQQQQQQQMQQQQMQQQTQATMQQEDAMDVNVAGGTPLTQRSRSAHSESWAATSVGTLSPAAMF